MPLVQALRSRGSKPYTATLHGEELKFLPDSQGRLVCNVQSQSLADILIGYPGPAFVLCHDAEPEITDDTLLGKVPAGGPGTGVSSDDTGDAEKASKYLIGDGENRVDLALLDDKQLHEFCKVNGIEINARARGDTIRDRIIEHLSAE